MRWLLLILLASPAFAEGTRFGAVGLGSSMASNEAGWAFRAENRLDFDKTDDDETAPIAGSRLGLETWDAGGHWGFAMPIGVYAGAQVKNMRTTIGGGLGLWTFEKSNSAIHGGVSPFASVSLEGTVGNLLISLDGRLARQVISETSDFNMYSVMLMFGKRLAR